ncbi:MAG: hypothetical protein NVS9B1_18580 [Candidatus Dormibacteraceae bacterium]
MRKAEEARRRELIAMARAWLSTASPAALHRLTGVVDRLLSDPDPEGAGFKELEALIKGRRHH